MCTKKALGEIYELGRCKESGDSKYSLHKDVFCPLNKYRWNTVLTAVKSRRLWTSDHVNAGNEYLENSGRCGEVLWNRHCNGRMKRCGDNMKMWSRPCPRHERTNNPKLIFFFFFLEFTREFGREGGRGMTPVLSSSPEVGDWSLSRPGRYTSGKESRYPPNRRLVWGPRYGMEVWGGKKNCHVPGFELRTVRPIALSLFRVRYSKS
jgi:hypothetical protein